MEIKNNLLIATIAATLMLTVQSCKKNLALYDEAASGSNVYFKEAIGAKVPLVKIVSFGYEGYSIKDSVVAIPVAVSGYPSSQDRRFQLKVADATTAIANTHYTFLRDPIIRAGRVVDTLLIKVNRTPEMINKQYELNLFLEQNDAFTTTLVDPAKNYLKYSIKMDDIAGISFLWTGSLKTGVNSYFGAYSRRKVDLMMEVLKLKPSFFYDSTVLPLPTSSQILSYGRFMFVWLNKEAAEGRIYLDENGEVIKMGQYAG